jgi:hypothetical protein
MNIVARTGTTPILVPCALEMNGADCIWRVVWINDEAERGVVFPII